MNTRSVVEILDKSGNKVGQIKNFYPLNEEGTILRYSKELSDYGKATFRVSKDDPLFANYGDILTPHKNQIRIKRAQKVVWQGGIIDNTERNKRYIEIEGAEYEWYLDRVLIRRDAEDNPGDGKDSFKVFDSGTMASNVTTLINNAASDFGSNHILGSLTTGTIENPNFPDNFEKANGDPLTGAWTFSSDISLTFDYHSVLYVLKAFGIYAGVDFQVNPDLTFDFKKRIGSKLHNFSFEYGTFGNIIDYNLPRLGSRMANSLVGIAATDEGVVFHYPLRDEESIKTYGLIQQPAAYSDVKNENALLARLREEMRFVKNPEVSPVNFVLNERGYPLGQYDIGDTIYSKVKDGSAIDFQDWRKIVGITVNLHNTGREITVVQTNQPRPEDLEK